jgi:hypothetical protein
MAPCILASDPFALAGGQGDLAVDGQRKLERNARTPELEPRQSAAERGRDRAAANAELHLDSGVPQASYALARGTRIWIAQCNQDAFGLRRNQEVRAGRATGTVVRARFKRHVNGRSGSLLARLFERNLFGVGPSAGCRRTLPDDFAAADDYATNVWIGRASAASILAERHRFCHEATVRGYIPSWFSMF